MRTEFTGNGRIDLGFVEVIEESEELVILFLADGIVLVVVTLRAADAESQPDGADGVGAIDDLLDAKLFAIDTAFTVGERVAVKARGHELFGLGAWQEVAGDLFDGEPIKREVAIECVDDILPPAPGIGADKRSGFSYPSLSA